MFDKIKDKVNDIRNTAIDKADDVVSGLKKKKKQDDTQLGKSMAIEDMKNDGTFDSIKKAKREKGDPFTAEELIANTKKTDSEESLADFGISSDEPKKKGGSTSYVGSIEYPETQPQTEPPVEESKSDVVDKVKDFVNDVTSPNKKGDSGKQRKRKLLVRRVTRLLQWVIIILIILFIRNRYISYSDRAVQKLTYKSFPYTYVIDRNARDFKVTKMMETDCKEEETKCKVNNLASYDLKLDDYQKYAIRTYFDFAFKFKNGDKYITKNDLNNELAERAIWTAITNDSTFLSMDRYKNYQIVDYEQKSDYKEKGFYYDEDENRMYITIALGQQKYDGYSIRVREAHKIKNDVIFYVEMEEPTGKKWKNDNAPIVKLEITEKPDNVKVVNLNNGENYQYKGHLIGDDSKTKSGISDIDVTNKGAEIK